MQNNWIGLWMWISLVGATTTISDLVDRVEIKAPAYDLQISRNIAPSITLFLLNANADV